MTLAAAELNGDDKLASRVIRLAVPANRFYLTEIHGQYILLIIFEGLGKR